MNLIDHMASFKMTDEISRNLVSLGVLSFFSLSFQGLMETAVGMGLMSGPAIGGVLYQVKHRLAGPLMGTDLTRTAIVHPPMVGAHALHALAPNRYQVIYTRHVDSVVTSFSGGISCSMGTALWKLYKLLSS